MAHERTTAALRDGRIVPAVFGDGRCLHTTTLATRGCDPTFNFLLFRASAFFFCFSHFTVSVKYIYRGIHTSFDTLKASRDGEVSDGCSV